MTSVKLSYAQREHVSLRRLTVAAAVGAALAAIGNIIVFVLGTALGVSFVFPLSPDAHAEQLPVSMVLVASTLPAFAAAALIGILARSVRQPFRVFTLIALAFGLLSLVGPFTLPVALSTKLALSTMHVIAGVAIVGTLLRLGREKQGAA